MRHPRRVLRRIGAVLAGALAGIILSIGIAHALTPSKEKKRGRTKR